MRQEKEKTLLSLKTGEHGYVVRLNTTNTELRRRLADAGLTYGVKVTFIRSAPFGDPLVIELRGYELSLRKDDAEKIIITGTPAFNSLSKTTKTNYSNQLRMALSAIQAPHLPYSAPKRSDIQSLYSSDNNVIALVGNPNSGKTTLFNALTSSHEYVGNWCGVTVEKKEGVMRLSDAETYATLVDLPGIYSLSPKSEEEVAARNFLLDETPSAIINIVDVTNIERNLYLTTQLIETEIPLVIALNMADELAERGIRLDSIKLENRLNIPVIPISAKTGMGLNELTATLTDIVKNHACHVTYYPIHNDIEYFSLLITTHECIGAYTDTYAKFANIPPTFARMKILEGDTAILRKLNMPDMLSHSIIKAISSFADSYAMLDTPSLVANSRYEFIEWLLHGSYEKESPDARSKQSRILDNIVTNKYASIPIFLCLMVLIFAITFASVGSKLSQTASTLMVNTVKSQAQMLLENIGTAQWLTSLICNGILDGVGGVLCFLPQIAILFFLLSIMEDGGYMARVAFIMDAPMRKIGLSGKSIIPMLMGFGCTVPAAMGTRVMETARYRRMTLLLLPFISCSAKLPVYSLIAGAFFGQSGMWLIISLYALGVLCAVAAGAFFKKTLFKDADAPFMSELPPYRMPTTKNTLVHVWERIKHFINKAGTIILVMSTALWFLTHLDMSFQFTEDIATSLLSRAGSFIAPIFTPLGFPFWQAAVALLTGIIAKESVVASLAMFYGFATSQNGAALATMSQDFTRASSISFLVFVLLYTPCAAALSTMHKEFMSRKWTVFSICLQLTAAYAVSAFVYALCSLLAF